MRKSLKAFTIHSLVEASLQVLQEELTGNEAMFPHLDNVAVVDGIAQLRQCHVQLVHPETTSMSCQIQPHTELVHPETTSMSCQIQPHTELVHPETTTMSCQIQRRHRTCVFRHAIFMDNDSSDSSLSICTHADSPAKHLSVFMDTDSAGGWQPLPFYTH